MDFISEGLSWFQDMRHTCCTQEILIGLTLATAKPIQATPSSDDASTTHNRLSLQKINFNFVVRRVDLESNEIKLQRGLKIWYRDDEYELSYDAKDIYEYNDTNRLDIVLKTVLVGDNNGLSPTYTPG